MAVSLSPSYFSLDTIGCFEASSFLRRSVGVWAENVYAYDLCEMS
jgi:hypothetical protein